MVQQANNDGYRRLRASSQGLQLWTLALSPWTANITTLRIAEFNFEIAPNSNSEPRQSRQNVIGIGCIVLLPSSENVGAVDNLPSFFSVCKEEKTKQLQKDRVFPAHLLNCHCPVGRLLPLDCAFHFMLLVCRNACHSQLANFVALAARPACVEWLSKTKHSIVLFLRCLPMQSWRQLPQLLLQLMVHCARHQTHLKGLCANTTASLLWESSNPGQEIHTLQTNLETTVLPPNHLLQ